MKVRNKIYCVVQLYYLPVRDSESVMIENLYVELCSVLKRKAVGLLCQIMCLAQFPGVFLRNASNGATNWALIYILLSVMYIADWNVRAMLLD